jgi:glycosyltransferase involved in cell wall biosynthesis
MTSPFLQVVIPCYGKSPYLEKAISSVIASVSPSTKITILDDCSPTQDVELVTAKFQARVEYIRNSENLGLAANFLKAFSISNAVFTVVMGSDDLMLPKYEEEIFAAVQKFPSVDVVQSKVSIINEGDQATLPLVDRIKSAIQGNLRDDCLVENDLLLKKLLIGDFMYFPAIAWRTSVILEKDWDLRYKIAVDLDLLFKTISSDGKFLFTSSLNFCYRRHSGSVSSILAKEDIRLREELAVHWKVRDILGHKGGWKIRLLAQLAITIRIHALIISLKQMPRQPIVGISHLINALSPIKPLAFHTEDVSE